MYETSLRLPERTARPRTAGITMMIDGGLPSRYFADVVESFSEHLDVVKFGWGTCLVTPDIESKARILRERGIDFYFGGTLFERFVAEGKFDEWRRIVDHFGSRVVEISNGTIDLPNSEKCRFISRMAGEYRVFSEVGSKDSSKSEMMLANEWLDYTREDLSAGSSMVILEARESGTSGICSSNGELRVDIIDAFISSEIDSDVVMFEAPRKEIQAHLIKRIGPNVNLGNIAAEDIAPLETLRLGLRGDTLTDLLEVTYA